MGDVVSSFLFQPPNPPTTLRLRSPSFCSYMERIWLTTSLGSRIPAVHIQRKHTSLTVLYSHGNAEDLGMLTEYLLDVSKILHVNIFAYDYTGYGFSTTAPTATQAKSPPPAPSEERCYADITAAYNYLTISQGISPSRIILYGRSLGSGPSCYLAQMLNKRARQEKRSSYCGPLASYTCDELSQVSSTSGSAVQQSDASSTTSDSEMFVQSEDTPSDYIGGLILHSPFSSIYRIVLDLGFTIQGDVFCNIGRVQDVLCPTFIIHGTKDEIVPFAHGQALHEALPDRCKVMDPFWARGMGHNNIEVEATHGFIRGMMHFLQIVRSRETGGSRNSDRTLGGNGSWDKHSTGLNRKFLQEHVSKMMDRNQQKCDGFLARKRYASTGKAQLQIYGEHFVSSETDDIDLEDKDETIPALTQPLKHHVSARRGLRSARNVSLSVGETECEKRNDQGKQDPRFISLRQEGPV